MNKISAETQNLLRNIQAASTYLDEDVVRKLNVILMRPRLEYAPVARASSLMKHVRKPDKIQRGNKNGT